MIGAAIGDIVGSRYESRPIKSKDFVLFDEGCRFTDDTVCTVAVIESLLEDQDPSVCLRKWGRLYPHRGYGAFFARWLFDDSLGAYGSLGNGAAMRVSPAGFLAQSEAEAISLANRVTLVTHNHPQALIGARATAAAIFLARSGQDPTAIRSRITRLFGYDLSLGIDEIRPEYRFDPTCDGTVPPGLLSALEAVDFQDAIRNAVSLGGDSDTLAAIAGGVAEALYGIPDAILETAKTFLDQPLLEMFDRLYRASSEV